MTNGSPPAEPRATTRRRARWLWGFPLLAIAALVLYWPPRLRVPLDDGTTLEIGKITTGTEHSNAAPLTWPNLQRQISRRSWKWPRQSARYLNPSTVFWFEDGQIFQKVQPLLVDRNGWRWRCRTIHVSGGCHMDFPPIESDGPLQVEILDGKGQTRLGAATLPIAGVRPDTSRSRSIEPQPLPAHQTDGPLSATLRTIEVDVTDHPISQARGPVRLDALWNGQPFEPEAVRVDIVDSLGREAGSLLERDATLITSLSPHETVWNMTFSIFRGRGMSLEPSETFTFKPTPSDETPLASWDGQVGGIGWRVVVANPSSSSIPLRYNRQGLSLIAEDDPVIAVEVESDRNVRVRIEPLQSDGTPLPVETIETNCIPTPLRYVRVVRCPEFDPARGDTVRVGFSLARQVRFAVQPVVRNSRDERRD